MSIPAAISWVRKDRRTQSWCVNILQITLCSAILRRLPLSSFRVTTALCRLSPTVWHTTLLCAVQVTTALSTSIGHGYGIGSWFQFHDQMLQELGNWLDAHPAPPVDAVRVACIGNSITDGHGIDLATLNGYPAQLQRLLGSGYWVKNFGVSARTLLNEGDYPYMKETAWRDALAFRPDVVVIKLGTNDSKPQNWKHHEAFEADLRQMLTQLNPSLGKKASKRSKKCSATQTPQPHIYLCTPIPAIKSTWEISDSVIVNGIIPIIQKVAKDYGLPVIDLHTLYANDSDKMLPDGIHPDERGARRIAQIVADALKQ